MRIRTISVFRDLYEIALCLICVDLNYLGVKVVIISGSSLLLYGDRESIISPCRSYCCVPSC